MVVVLHDVLNATYTHSSDFFVIKDELYNRKNFGLNLSKKVIEDIKQQNDLRGVSGIFCSINLMNFLMKDFCHLFFYDENSFKQSVYSKYVKTINHDQIFVPWHKIKNQKEQIYKYFGDKVFIRPDNPTKIFTGLTINYDNFETEINAIEKTTSVNSSTWISVSSAKKIIDTEWRFWIVDGKIIQYTSYSWDFNQEKIEPAKDMISFVEKSVFGVPYEAFVIDCTKTENDQNYVIELNSINNSGFYGMPVEPIVDKLKNKEWIIYS